MPRVKKSPYTCPSCGYETENKTNMSFHFYNLKKECPKQKNNIELTEDVKKYVLANRIWHSPKIEQIKPTFIINQQYNMVINNIDPISKISRYIAYMDDEMISFEDKVENKYKKHVYKLENNAYKYGYELDRDSFLNIIDEVSQATYDKIQEMNVVYDDTGKKLKLYDGEWKSLRIKCAIKEMLKTIKAYYLDSYEEYLIKKANIHSNDNAFERQKAEELLLEYYHFLACMDTNPYIKEYDGFGDDIQDMYFTKYKTIYGQITNADKQRTFKEVVEIVTRNSKSNIKELNRKIISILKMDAEFRNIIEEIIT